MTKNQEETIERLNKFKKIEVKPENTIGVIIQEFKTLQNDIETVLNMLKEKDKEIEILKRDFEIVDDECSRLERKEVKQEKIIDLMTDEINSLHVSLIEEYGDYKTDFSESGEEVSPENIKQYFERKATNDG